MPRSQRPGNTFCLGVIGAYVAVHYDLNGWLVAGLAIAIGWALNESETRERQ